MTRNSLPCGSLMTVLSVRKKDIVVVIVVVEEPVPLIPPQHTWKEKDTVMDVRMVDQQGLEGGRGERRRRRFGSRVRGRRGESSDQRRERLTTVLWRNDSSVLVYMYLARGARGLCQYQQGPSPIQHRR